MYPDMVAITRRLALPSGVSIRKQTSIYLGFRESVRRHDVNHSTVIELFIILMLEGEKEPLFLETDGVVQWSSIPCIAEDRRRWEQVRQLVVAGEDTPNEAYLKVAFELLAKQWKFEMVSEGDAWTTSFEIIRSKASADTIVAQVEGRHGVDAFFNYDK